MGRTDSRSGDSLKTWRRMVTFCALAATCGGCGSNLKMRVGAPLQVTRGYGITETKFYQHGRELDRSDVKEKLAGHSVSANSVYQGQGFETAGLVTRGLGFILLNLGISGLLPNNFSGMSKGTSVGMLSGAAVALGVSVGLGVAAESNYVDAVEQHNARFSPSLNAGTGSAARSVSNQPAREEFPQKVAGYSFRMKVNEAEAVCRRATQQWSLDGSEAQCTRTERSGKDALDVRLRFSLGVLSGITVSYKSAPQVLSRDYAHFAKAFRDKYGKPQVEASQPPGACATALAQCLAEGEKVKAVVWSWARGSLELEPVWRDERAQIELRYLEVDASGP